MFFSEPPYIVETGSALRNDQARMSHFHHFSMVALPGSINHVFGPVTLHDCKCKLSLAGTDGASNQDVGLSLCHWAKRTAPHANRAP